MSLVSLRRASFEDLLVLSAVTGEGSAVIPAEVLRALGFFSSPGLLSVLEPETQTVEFVKGTKGQ